MIEHVKEANMHIPKDPILFIKPRTALAGPGELTLSKAAQDHQFDYGTELGLVIGQDALEVREEGALDYVLGWVSHHTMRCLIHADLSCSFTASKNVSVRNTSSPIHNGMHNSPQLARLYGSASVKGSTIPALSVRYSYAMVSSIPTKSVQDALQGGDLVPKPGYNYKERHNHPDGESKWYSNGLLVPNESSERVKR